MKKLPIVIGPLLVIYIFSRYITLGELFAVFQGSSRPILILAYISNIMLFLGKTLRLHASLKKSSIPITFFYTLKIYALTNLIGQASNILMSDIANAVTLMFNRENKLRITNIFILNRIFDLMAVFLILAVTFGLNYTVLSTFTDFSFWHFLFFVFFLMLAIPLAIRYHQQFLIAYRDLRKLLKETIVIYLTCLIVICAFFVLSAWSEARALHLYLPTSFILLSYTLGSLISILPISIAGIGTRDMLFIFLLGLVHVPAEMAVALSVLGFIIIPPLSLTTLLLIAWIGGRYADRHNN